MTDIKLPSTYIDVLSDEEVAKAVREIEEFRKDGGLGEGIVRQVADAIYEGLNHQLTGSEAIRQAEYLILLRGARSFAEGIEAEPDSAPRGG